VQEQRNIAINCLSGCVRLVHARLTELTAVVAESQSNQRSSNEALINTPRTRRIALTCNSFRHWVVVSTDSAGEHATA
jgi:hypothetical protein